MTPAVALTAALPPVVSRLIPLPGGVADRKASRGQYSQTAVVVGADPDSDLDSGGHSAQPGAWVVEGEDLFPSQTLPSGPVRAVLGHAPAVSPAAPRIVKPAETAESARAGIVVSTADVQVTARATATPRSRLIQP
jgi:hypothetical protein